MKKKITFIMLLVFSLGTSAQLPQKMSYQCVVRNSSKALVTNHTIGIKVSILQGTVTGTVVYSETYNPAPQTNENGLVTLEIGSGVPVTGTFAGIDWSSGPFFIKTETDPEGGTNYSVTGTSQILSVPYAFYSKNAETAVTKTELNDIVKSIKGVLSGTKLIDIDGNIYNIVTIGNQVWMAENLRTATYNDGTPVPEVMDNQTWSGLHTGAYCWYNNDSATYEVPYGKLYNFHVVSGGKICPAGWHVPNNTELNVLLNYLGPITSADKLKETGTVHWSHTTITVTNETGFTALPGGARPNTFRDIREIGYWWTSSLSKVDPYYYSMYAHDSKVQINTKLVNTGFSIRCIKD